MRSSSGHHPDQSGDGAMAFDRMPEEQVVMDEVAIGATFTHAAEIPCLLQFGDDALHGALRDADPDCNLAHSRCRLLDQAERKRRS